MFKEGICRPSNSPWAFPILMVRKPDGNIRSCFDARRINDITRKDASIPYLGFRTFFNSLVLNSSPLEMLAADFGKSHCLLIVFPLFYMASPLPSSPTRPQAGLPFPWQ